MLEFLVRSAVSRNVLLSCLYPAGLGKTSAVDPEMLGHVYQNRGTLQCHLIQIQTEAEKQKLDY